MQEGEPLHASKGDDDDDDEEEEGAMPADSRSARERARAALEAMLTLSAEQYVDLAFEVDSGSLMFDEPQVRAASAYDQRHTALTGAARKNLIALEYDPTCMFNAEAYASHVCRVRRNRYFVPEAALEWHAIKAKVKRRRRPRWRLETSCWAPRKANGNSKDFFETPDAMRQMFNFDWGVAVRSIARGYSHRLLPSGCAHQHIRGTSHMHHMYICPCTCMCACAHGLLPGGRAHQQTHKRAGMCTGARA